MFKRREGFLHGHNQIKLFFQVWEKPQAQGTLIINHGQGEHSDSYVRVIEALKDEPWNIFACDMRGHGRSEGKRGYSESFDYYCEDYHIFVKKVLSDWRVDGPVALLAHSMGALVQLKTLIYHPEFQAQVRAQVLSSPLLGVAVPVPAWKNKAAELLNQVLPTVTLWNELTNDMLSRDPDVIREFEQDVLRHNRMSSGVYLGMNASMAEVHQRASEIKIPTLLQIPEDDMVVSTPENKRFFENLGATDKKILVYGDGARHEIYNDICRGVVLNDMREYLREKMKGAA